MALNCRLVIFSFLPQAKLTGLFRHGISTPAGKSLPYHLLRDRILLHKEGLLPTFVAACGLPYQAPRRLIVDRVLGALPELRSTYLTCCGRTPLLAVSVQRKGERWRFSNKTDPHPAVFWQERLNRADPSHPVTVCNDDMPGWTLESVGRHPWLVDDTFGRTYLLPWQEGELPLSSETLELAALHHLAALARYEPLAWQALLDDLSMHKLLEAILTRLPRAFLRRLNRLLDA